MSDLTVTTIVGAPIRRRPADLIRAGLRIGRLMLARSRERQFLASMDARMLHDIGVTPLRGGRGGPQALLASLRLECAANLRALPPTGVTVATGALRIAGGTGGPGRALAPL